MTFNYLSDQVICRRYEEAREIYAAYGVDTERAIEQARNTRLSAHCWQGDDVGGFEVQPRALSGGIMTTGKFPGKARNGDELRTDLEKALSLVPGKHKVNLHAIYLESDGKFVERDRVGVEHFARWLDWAAERNLGLDFNPTFFSHEKADSGFTLSSPDRATREFWIEHGRRCREIAAAFAKRLKDDCVINFWIPDGYKDTPVDRWSPRARLTESLDAIFATPAGQGVVDAVEGKLFGIGSESYVTGSNEFYLAYAVSRGKTPCLDMGHYHPTETIHDKLSAILPFTGRALLHVSRGVRWDSDHVVILNDDIQALCREIVRGDALSKVFVATDFFDAGINRIGAWVTGLRATSRGLLYAALDPIDTLRKLENEGRFAERLAFAEEIDGLPKAQVWDYFCLTSGVKPGASWIQEMIAYEKQVLTRGN